MYSTITHSVQLTVQSHTLYNVECTVQSLYCTVQSHTMYNNIINRVISRTMHKFGMFPFPSYHFEVETHCFQNS